jgi:glycosyltransferase involved in cell wall biosynthesis
MKVLHLITGLTTGGAEMMLYKVLVESDRSKVRSYVISLRDGGTLGCKIEELGIPVWSLNLISLIHLPKALWRLYQISRKIKPSIIQGWMYHGNFFSLIVNFFLLGSAAVFWNIRQSISSLSDEKPLTAFFIYSGGILSSFASCIIYNSNVSRLQHEAIGYKKTTSKIIPNGFDTEIFKPNPLSRIAIRSELNIDPDACVIGLVARFHPMKDHENFLNAAAKLRNEFPNVIFVLAGTDVTYDNNVLRSLIGLHNLNDSIRLIGERHDMACVTASFDFAVNSSWRGEAFPNAIGESMACGVPCVVTDVGDSASIIADTGAVVPIRNPTSLADALKRLMDSDPLERKLRASKARNRIIKFFSIENVANQYLNYYKLAYLNLNKEI